jgi:hypothetical protein
MDREYAFMLRFGSVMVTTFVPVEESADADEGAPAEAAADDVSAPQAAPIAAVAITLATKPVITVLFIVMPSFLMHTACLGNRGEGLYPGFSC